MGVSMASIELGEDGDGVKSTKFTGGRTEDGSETAVLGLPGLVLDVEEEEGVEVVLLQ